MTRSGADSTFEQLEQLVYRLNPEYRLRRAWPLSGGVSAQVTALEIEQPDGRTKRMIVRQHGAADRQRNPHIARDEFRLLQALRAAGLRVPTPYDFDESGEIFVTPVLVVEYIEGETVFQPLNLSDYIRQMAAHLVAIHRFDGSSVDLSYLPEPRQRYAQAFRVRPAHLDDTLSEGPIRDVLEAVWPLPPHNPPGLLHGDFWPGNLLWHNDQLAGILDWEDATIGDPLEDLANSRLEILWAFGDDAMQQFTDAYQSLNPIHLVNLPYWDLCAALRPAFKIDDWAADEQAARTMRERHGWFIAQAFDRLPEP